MFAFLRRSWRYLTAAASGKFEEIADPKIQLEQAIKESQEQHRRLLEQAANVIANQKQTEMRLNRAMEDLERLNGSMRQALLMVDDATKQGDAAKASEYNSAAEAYAHRTIGVEREVDSLKQLHLQTTQAADQAKAAVAQNSAALQQKLTERQKLLSQLDQAKMQEQVNKAMASLAETVGHDVPSFDEVRDKIEARYARALGAAEANGQTVEHRMLDVEQTQMAKEAQARLAEVRTQLGLAVPAPQPAVTAGAGPADNGRAAG